jgi:hypothetical protein
MSDARLLGISYSWETGDGRLGGVGFGSAAGWVRVKVYVEQRWTSSDTPIGERVRRWSGTFVADTAEFQSKIASNAGR